jgi:hypothetical protein
MPRLLRVSHHSRSTQRQRSERNMRCRLKPAPRTPSRLEVFDLDRACISFETAGEELRQRFRYTLGALVSFW